MDVRKACETLGVARGASAEEVEAAFERLRSEIDARLSRVQGGPVAARYRELRARLATARATILAAPSAAPDEPLAHAFEVLGLSPSASPLDVASAYVALCEEIDREVRDASTEELRRACLEARADVDAAYQRCALSPLHEEGESGAGEGGSTPPAHYETQMAAAPFQAPERAPTSPVLRIEPEPEGESRRARRRRRRVRRMAVAAAWLLTLTGGVAAGIWWFDLEPRALVEEYVPEVVMTRLAPPGPPPELLDAQSTAESLRRRVAEERVELQSRVEQTRARVEELERTWSSAADPAQRERMADELDQLRARRDLAIQHARLAEQHVLSGEDLTVAYGRMGQASELKLAGDADAALAAFEDARRRLEAALARLDLVENAVGARSEAEAGLEAWQTLAASADLADHAAAVRGEEILAEARALLAEGEFERAIPELQRASQQFATAVADGRKVAAAARARELAQAEAQDDEGTEPERASDAAEAVADAEPTRAADPSTPAAAVQSSVPPVSAAPPDIDRAAIKLVEVPGGEFLYGAPARRVSLRSFLIDRTEVRVNEYRDCVEAGACSEPGSDAGCNWSHADRGDHPVNCVSWSQAHDYCQWVGKRLPTEREWEKAARGTDGRIYPWGNDDASCTQAVIAGSGAPGCGRDSTSPVASRAEGRSPFGLFDMAGNVLEWTADRADAGERVVRGGSWRSPAGPARSSYRDRMDASVRNASIGFRCAQDDGLYASSVP